MSQKEVILYVTRHGKTMFNTIERVQGWCDTPLTREGEEVVGYFGEGVKNIPFVAAFSSDSGRAIQTAQIALNRHSNPHIPFKTDKRIREWCFGSLEGGYDGEMWGVLPRILAFKDYSELVENQISYEQIANAIVEADTADWAEPYDVIKNRIWNGFKDIGDHVEKMGGGEALIVSHGFTISHLLNLIDPTNTLNVSLENVSVTKLRYSDGKFEILSIGDTSYIKKGKALINKLSV